MNVPPVAIIRPSSQVIHLPNNVSVFDGSQSTDDSKIVAYNWNMEKGPINYKFEPINLETIMLKGKGHGMCYYCILYIIQVRNNVIM